jgi:3-oxoacyl-[acyl-carrier protein] reductase
LVITHGDTAGVMLNEETALVTGASRGIGRAIAMELSRLGATVIGTATTDQGAAAISEALPGASTGRVLDVTAPQSVAALIKQVTDDFTAPTILVNNAGVTRDTLLMRMDEDDWDVILETNLKSVYRVSKAVLRGMMKARRGRIINIGSVVAATGNAGQCNYAAAKAGMGGFTRSLAREVGSRGITVNMVAPGFIDTDMTRALPDGQRDALIGQIPLGRLGTTQDVANAVAFLASEAGAYITGTTLDVNGGMSMNS